MLKWINKGKQGVDLPAQGDGWCDQMGTELELWLKSYKLSLVCLTQGTD